MVTVSSFGLGSVELSLFIQVLSCTGDGVEGVLPELQGLGLLGEDSGELGFELLDEAASSLEFGVDPGDFGAAVRDTRGRRSLHTIWRGRRQREFPAPGGQRGFAQARLLSRPRCPRPARQWCLLS